MLGMRMASLMRSSWGSSFESTNASALEMAACTCSANGYQGWVTALVVFDSSAGNPFGRGLWLESCADYSLHLAFSSARARNATVKVGSAAQLIRVCSPVIGSPVSPWTRIEAWTVGTSSASHLASAGRI